LRESKREILSAGRRGQHYLNTETEAKEGTIFEEVPSIKEGRNP